MTIFTPESVRQSVAIRSLESCRLRTDRYLDLVADEPETSRRPLAIKLTWWNRAIFDVLGLAGLGAGAAAVFITHLEAGPVALIAAGLLLLLIGIGGHMPSRLKVGDNEAAWEIEREAVQTFVERVATEAPVESRPELLDALGDLAEDAPQAAIKGLAGLAFEQRVGLEISAAVISLGESQVSFSIQERADQGVDAVLQGPGGRLVAVEIKYSARSVSSAWIEMMDQRLLSRSPSYFRAILLITKTRLTRSAERTLKKYPEFRHLIYEDLYFMEKLTDTLRELLLPTP